MGWTGGGIMNFRNIDDMIAAQDCPTVRVPALRYDEDDDGEPCDECGCCPCECCEECHGGGAIQTDAGSYFGPPNERPCRACGETGRRA